MMLFGPPQIFFISSLSDPNGTNVVMQRQEFYAAQLTRCHSFIGQNLKKSLSEPLTSLVASKNAFQFLDLLRAGNSAER